jgi:hypothetical protein
VDVHNFPVTPPRVFAIINEDRAGGEDVVAGWGLDLADGVIYTWAGGSAVAVFSSAERVLRMVEMTIPARLLWLDRP